MKITICVGSSCHIKGSQGVVEKLKELIEKNDLQEKITLGGTFCMNNCQQDVCVAIDDLAFSVSPKKTEDFFEKEVLTRL